MSKVRGSALISVLSLAVILMIIGFTLAIVSLADLSFAANFRAGMSEEMLAQAAITQFESEARASVRTVDWARRFADQPVFPDGGLHLPGTVEISFNTNSTYFSVDNSNSSVNASGWRDRHSSTSKSVPPFTVDLVMTIRNGSRVSHYEALLQQVWPYALMTRSPIILSGTPQLDPTLPYAKPASVVGPVLLCAEPPTPDTPTGPYILENDLFDSVYRNTHYSSLNGNVTQWKGLINVGTTPSDGGNLVAGRVDLNQDAAQNSSVYLQQVSGAAAPNKATGRVRHNIKATDAEKARLMGIFTYPDLGETPYANITNALQNGTVLQGTAVGSNTTSTATYIMNATINLPDSLPDGEKSPDGRYLFVGSLYNEGNVTVGTNTQQLLSNVTHAGLSLKNSQLYVQGDLHLRSHVNDTISLTGVNATLIVDGALVVERGTLDAGEQGMVILCRRLFVSASGNYRGLLLAQESAVLCRPEGDDQGGLAVQGALLCGGRPVSVNPDPTNADPIRLSYGTQTARGVILQSGSVEYDPRYARAIQKYGDWQTLSLRRLD